MKTTLKIISSALFVICLISFSSCRSIPKGAEAVNNFDVNKYLFTKEAYLNKKYAFVADVCRLEVLNEFGGIYLDTDMELIKPIENINSQLVLGFEDVNFVAAGIIPSFFTLFSKAANVVIKIRYIFYRSYQFIKTHSLFFGLRISGIYRNIEFYKNLHNYSYNMLICINMYFI